MHTDAVRPVHTTGKLVLELQRAFANRLGESIESIHAIARGPTLNQHFRAQTRTSRWVIKRFAYWKVLHDLAPARRAQREFLGLTLCERHGLLIPRPIDSWDDVVVMQELDAAPVRLLTRGNWIERIAEWLALFHALPIPDELSVSRDLPVIEARRQIDRVVRAHPNDRGAQILRDLLLSHCFPCGPRSLVRGDAMLGNWLTDGRDVFGVDFEFTSIGGPSMDLGGLAASILTHHGFEPFAYAEIRELLRSYASAGGRIIPGDIRYGALCGFALNGASAPSVAMRAQIFAGARSAIERLEPIC